MATVYNGNGSLVTPTTGAGVRRQIFSTTNAAPISVSTVSAHGFNTGDTVEIEGHLSNTTANALSQITVVDSKHFLINGSSGIATGSSTGYAIDYELQPAIVVPSGGELVDPGVIGAALEGIDNLGPYLYRAAGRYKLYNIYTKTGGTAQWSNWSVTTLTSASLVTLGSTSNIMSFAAPAPIVQPGDILDFTLMVSGGWSSIGGSQQFGMGVTITLSVDGSAGFGGAFQSLTATTTGSGIMPLMFRGIFGSSTILSQNQTFDFSLFASGNTWSNNVTVSLIGTTYTIIKHYRPN